MKISNPKNLLKKELIIFDLDGTIAPSKSAMDQQMANLIVKLLLKMPVAVISGGELKQFKIQLLNPLAGHKANLKNLLLFPTTSTSFYKYQKGKWKNVYAHVLSKAEIKRINSAFKKAFEQTGYKYPKKTYGIVIENRSTQVTFSALGQKVVAELGTKGVKLKEQWAKHSDARPMLASVLRKLLPAFEVRIAGLTSIDVTRKGIDKAYGVKQIQKQAKIPIKKMLFVGDAIFPGGNDYQALKTGIDYVAVKSTEETKKLIKSVLK